MFADDTNLFLNSQNLNDLIVIANNVLAKLVKWFNLNKLSRNIKKKHKIHIIA